jgi:Trk K+ transport system NAD-binding subunit
MGRLYDRVEAGRAGLSNTSRQHHDRITPSHHRAIVAGYGVVGRMVALELERSGLTVTIIELNLNTIEKQLGLDKKVVYGDVLDPDTLRKAGIDHADVFVLAVPDEEDAVNACRVARELNPDIFIAARTNFVSKGMLCTQAGADCVIVEEIVTAQAMQRAIIEKLNGDGQSGEVVAHGEDVVPEIRGSVEDSE